MNKCFWLQHNLLDWGYLKWLTSNYLQKQVDTIHAQYVSHANFWVIWVDSYGQGLIDRLIKH